MLIKQLKVFTSNSPKRYLQSILELSHDLHAAGEGDGGQSGEGQLKTHDSIENVVHAGEIVDVGVKSDEERWHDGDGTGEEDTLPPCPLKIEEALHGELTSVRARHRGRLAGGQDTKGPDYQGGVAELTAKEDTALVKIGLKRILVVL